MRLPHCYLCHKEGDCSKGTMKSFEVEEGISVYLCSDHFNSTQEAIELYYAQKKG